MRFLNPEPLFAAMKKILITMEDSQHRKLRTISKKRKIRSATEAARLAVVDFIEAAPETKGRDSK